MNRTNLSVLPNGGSIISNKESDCNPVIHLAIVCLFTRAFFGDERGILSDDHHVLAHKTKGLMPPFNTISTLLFHMFKSFFPLVILAKGERIVKRNDHKVLKRRLFILLPPVTNVISNFAFQMQNLFHILHELSISKGYISFVIGFSVIFKSLET